MTKIDTFDSMQPLRSAGAATWRRRPPSRKCSRRPILRRSVDIPTDSEKQNKIEAIELEAMSALRTSISNGSPELAQVAREPITELSQSGLVSVRSQALELLQSLQNKP